MLQKLIVIAVAAALLIGGVFLYDYSTKPMAWCFKGYDKCAVEAMNLLRSKKELAQKQNKETFEKNELAIIQSFDPKIEALKPTISVGAAIKEAQEGDKRNVKADFLTFLGGVPQAIASETGDDGISLSEQPPETFLGTRLEAFLESKNSPFAHVDLYKIAKESGITEDQMYQLVAISGKEGSWGTTYTSTRGGIRRSEPVLGLEYKNATGLKNPRIILEGCPANTPIPDNNGMWLQRYDTWEQYFSCYFRQMKNGYFDKGLNTPAEMSTIYLTGDKAKWALDVTNFKAEIKSFLNK